MAHFLVVAVFSWTNAPTVLPPPAKRLMARTLTLRPPPRIKQVTEPVVAAVEEPVPEKKEEKPLTPKPEPKSKKTEKPAAAAIGFRSIGG